MWKAKSGRLEVSEARRLRALETENAKLKKLLAEAMLDNAMLKDIAGKNGAARRQAGSCHSPAPGLGGERGAGVRDDRSGPQLGALIAASDPMTARCGGGCGSWQQAAGASATGSCRSCCGVKGSRSTTRSRDGSMPRAAAGAPRRRPQAGARHPGTDGAAAGSEPALVAGFPGRRPDRRPAVRILAVVDDFTRECLCLVAVTSLPGVRVARELDAVISARGRPAICVSDSGTELTSLAILQ